MQRLANASRILFWLVLALLFVSQALQPYWLSAARTQVLKRFQDERKSRVIGLIHRQDTVSLLGFPVASYINIDDSEAVLRAIRLTSSCTLPAGWCWRRSRSPGRSPSTKER
jgi:ClpP class serine protease